MSDIDVAITSALLKEHFPIDVTEPDDCDKWFHCSCGFVGIGHALSRDAWLAHFGKLLSAN